jgi:hypothetical protein
VEQRIGPSSQPLKGEPVTGAGFDPAFIPGLSSPVSEEPEEVEAEDAAEAEDAEDTPDAGAPSGDAGTSSDDVGTPSDDDEALSDDDEEAAPDGPVFEASDRRAKIVADHRGVRLALDDQACEFRWDEIGAVETESPRFGKRFTITVHTPDRRWYPIEIEATSRSRFGEWDAQLDAVLDAYFDEGAEDEDAAEEPDVTEEQDTAEAQGTDAKAAEVKAADAKAADAD